MLKEKFEISPFKNETFQIFEVRKFRSLNISLRLTEFLIWYEKQNEV